MDKVSGLIDKIKKFMRSAYTRKLCPTNTKTKKKKPNITKDVYFEKKIIKLPSKPCVINSNT